MKLKITNKTKSPPRIPVQPGSIISAATLLQPGQSGEIDQDAHKLQMQVSRSYRALVDQGGFVVGNAKETDELVDIETADAPAELTDPTDAAGNKVEKTDSTVTEVEIEVPAAAPAADTRTPAQKGADTRRANKAAAELAAK